VQRYCTLKELALTLSLTPETLRDRIREGRLEAVKQYIGGNRDDPRSYRWLVHDTAAIAFMQREVLSMLTATTPRLPGFMHRGLKGRFARND